MTRNCTAKLLNLLEYQERQTSQNGEDGVLARLFAVISPVNRVSVEFGAGDGRECNTRALRERHGWQTICWDREHQNEHVHRQHVTADNLRLLLSQYKVPHRFDLLSIDVDGVDYWLWEAVQTPWRPQAVIIEYNPYLPPWPAVTVPYDPDFRWDSTTYFGASLGALDVLGRRKGYQLLCCIDGVNAVFVERDLVPGWPYTVTQMWKPLAKRHDWLSREPERRSDKPLEHVL